MFLNRRPWIFPVYRSYQFDVFILIKVFKNFLNDGSNPRGIYKTIQGDSKSIESSSQGRSVHVLWEIRSDLGKEVENQNSQRRPLLQYGYNTVELNSERQFLKKNSWKIKDLTRLQGQYMPDEMVINETVVTPAAGSRVFDRYEFVSESPAVGVLVLIVLIVASVVGGFGNLLILVSLWKSKTMKSLECIFIGNLAISDLYVTMVADPMSIVGKFSNNIHSLINYFDLNPIIIGKIW